MSDRNPAHTGPADPEHAADLSERAGIADEGAAFSNAIERDPGGDQVGNVENGSSAAGANHPAIGAGTAGDPGIVDRPSAAIDLADGDAVERWADRYSVTRAQLEEAVSAVGNDAHAVQTYLRGQGGGD
ncbi:DUF3606 domain-containing protein [Sphingomonas sp. JC676]|uniref:DUF3606 domain-containing protein n=1 Tax=Sphingomonas sp. JC676 TaxID=2768065 RepID=UPI001658425C|nr:DUF3606 domain-containing protein [Sphingomonas sp. JC676]MBC9033879.1 DUF3606 domain-containing protein [Sphingomonas sp. JC676]